MNNVLGYTLANANIILQAPPVTSDTLRTFNAGGKSILENNMPVNPGFLSGINTRLNGRPEWNMVKLGMGGFLESLNDVTRKYYLGAFTLRQLSELAGSRIPQFRTFIQKTEALLDDRNQRLERVRKISVKWQKWQSTHPDLAKVLNTLMIDVTLDDRPSYIAKIGSKYKINKDPAEGKL